MRLATLPFWLGVAGFMLMVFVVPAVFRWMEYNPWLRYKVAGVLIIAAMGFGSAYLMSGMPKPPEEVCYRIGGRADDFCY